jgi:SNF2 family DNA or RNA helicase
MAKAIYEFQAEYRWCLTGTPTQNSLGDLFSLVKFLRYTPWCW